MFSIFIDSEDHWLLRYFRLKRPGVEAMMRRLHVFEVVLREFSLPRLCFSFKIPEVCDGDTTGRLIHRRELEDTESEHFDRQVDTDDAIVVLDWQLCDFEPGTMIFVSDAMEWQVLPAPPSELRSDLMKRELWQRSTSPSKDLTERENFED